MLASMRTSGPSANAWWGQGIYTVPKDPASWGSCMEILDNNFRNMMARDRLAQGDDFVNKVYPPRVAYCIPILADPEICYDVSVRPTPEMQEAGKPPGTNLADKPLTEAGRPERVCVVIRVEDSTQRVQGARARLADTLHMRAKAMAKLDPGHAESVSAHSRLAWALLRRAKVNQAMKVLDGTFAAAIQSLSFKHPKALTCANAMAEALRASGKLAEVEKLHRSILGARERVVSVTHPDVLRSATNLACVLQEQGKVKECEALFQRAFAGESMYFGALHVETLRSASNLAAFLFSVGRHQEAEELTRRTLEGRETLLGSCHPQTLMTVNNLAASLQAQGKLSEAEQLSRRAADGQEETLGLQHPDTQQSFRNLICILEEGGERVAAEEVRKRSQEVKTNTLEAMAAWDETQEGSSSDMLSMLTSEDGDGQSPEPPFDIRDKYRAKMGVFFQTGGGCRRAEEDDGESSSVASQQHASTAIGIGL